MKPCCRKALMLGAAACIVCGLAVPEHRHTHTERPSDFVLHADRADVVALTTTTHAFDGEGWWLGVQRGLMTRSDGTSPAALRVTLASGGDDALPPAPEHESPPSVETEPANVQDVGQGPIVQLSGTARATQPRLLGQLSIATT